MDGVEESLFARYGLFQTGVAGEQAGDFGARINEPAEIVSGWEIGRGIVGFTFGLCEISSSIASGLCCLVSSFASRLEFLELLSVLCMVRWMRIFVDG